VTALLQWSTADSNATLRRLVSEQRAQIADLLAERDLLRATLLGEATVADAESEPADRKGATWWMATWRERWTKRNDHG
jgi:hypothetical protein